MRARLDGSPASEGLALGPLRVVEWGVPTVPHITVGEGQIEAEVERFHSATAWARVRLAELQQVTLERLGPVEARIFDPQLLMLDDDEVVAGTLRYIRENRLTAARAFDWRILELRAMWNRTAHPMVLDRLNDLEDLQVRILSRLLDLPDPDFFVSSGEPVVVVTTNIAPSLAVRMDPENVLAIAAEQGTRTSHWAILARSMEMPAVVGVPGLMAAAREASTVLVDGRHGRVVMDPDEQDRADFLQRRERLQVWTQPPGDNDDRSCTTVDGVKVCIRGNLDLPVEAEPAARQGAQGVGLFRTEFLVVGRRTMPDEEEQFRAYRRVAQAFPDHPVQIRTFDLGGDKFPMFLESPAEENPFLGWRAVRVCLDRPDLFRPQLRAILRASTFGDVGLMVPLVNNAHEMQQVRALLEDEAQQLTQQGIAHGTPRFGVLIETPAAALNAETLAEQCDFFSIGTNDLVQYTLAVDRTSARLANRYNPFHPSVVRQIDRVARVASEAGIEVSVCGELAAEPLGAFLLLGLGVDTLSVAWPAVPELADLVGRIRITDAQAAARNALAAGSSADILQILAEGLDPALSGGAFTGRWTTERSR